MTVICSIAGNKFWILVNKGIGRRVLYTTARGFSWFPGLLADLHGNQPTLSKLGAELNKKHKELNQPTQNENPHNWGGGPKETINYMYILSTGGIINLGGGGVIIEHELVYLRLYRAFLTRHSATSPRYHNKRMMTYVPTAVSYALFRSLVLSCIYIYTAALLPQDSVYFDTPNEKS